MESPWCLKIKCETAAFEQHVTFQNFDGVHNFDWVPSRPVKCMLVRDVRCLRHSREELLMKQKCRSGKRLGRVFVDLGGRKDVSSVGGKHYPMVVKDDFTRRTWLYFLKNISDAGRAFRSLLASVRADGIPSLVEIVRSDNGGEFFGGELHLCVTSS